MKRSEKEKPPYTTWQNIAFTLSNMKKWDRKLVLISAAQAPLNVLLQLSALYIVRLVISLIENDSDVLSFILNVAIVSGAILLLHMISNTMKAQLAIRRMGIRDKYIKLLYLKTMDADYQNIECPSGMDKMEKAMQTLMANGNNVVSVMDSMVLAVTSMLGVLSLFAIITTMSPILLIVITALLLVQHFINRAGHRWQYQNAGKWVPIDRKLNHVSFISGDFERAKDVRLYSLQSWLKDTFADVLHKRIGWYKKAERASFCYYDLNQAITQFVISNGIMFAYMILNVSSGALTIADAVFYLSAIGTLSGVIMDVFASVSQINEASLSICHLRDYLDMPDTTNRGMGAKLPDEAVEIEFENVDFIYPKAESSALKKISFHIRKGEKVAIVGRNGAGKTTLVKLLCGLYQPTAGKIKVYGKEISDYNRDEYFSLISAVFQDIHLYPASIAQNITLCEEESIDKGKLAHVIQIAGLREKIDNLPDGDKTILVKSVVDDAIDLSGGERQKLALARALYKDGPILVLDEPTAALDPIAESEIYHQYGEFSQGRTSIFISHRLSSTRFCDRILYMEDGRIVETGSHYELMMLNGKYAEMFNIQSHYYKEDAADEQN